MSELRRRIEEVKGTGGDAAAGFCPLIPERFDKPALRGFFMLPQMRLNVHKCG
jgi:hypothetical protein